MQLEISEEDFYHLLHSSVQYAMGRMSYIVGSTCDVVKQYAHLLTQNHRQTLTKNIKNDLELCIRAGNTCGMQMDHDLWVDLLKFLEEVR